MKKGDKVEIISLKHTEKTFGIVEGMFKVGDKSKITFIERDVQSTNHGLMDCAELEDGFSYHFKDLKKV